LLTNFRNCRSPHCIDGKVKLSSSNGISSFIFPRRIMDSYEDACVFRIGSIPFFQFRRTCCSLPLTYTGNTSLAQIQALAELISSVLRDLISEACFALLGRQHALIVEFRYESVRTLNSTFPGLPGSKTDPMTV